MKVFFRDNKGLFCSRGQFICENMGKLFCLPKTTTNAIEADSRLDEICSVDLVNRIAAYCAAATSIEVAQSTYLGDSVKITEEGVLRVYTADNSVVETPEQVFLYFLAIIKSIAKKQGEIVAKLNEFYDELEV